MLSYKAKKGKGRNTTTRQKTVRFLFPDTSGVGTQKFGDSFISLTEGDRKVHCFFVVLK